MQTVVDRECGALDEGPSRAAGFALRRRLRAVAERAWHDTVTHYTPEPWLIALARDRAGASLTPGRRPEASR